VQVVLARSKRFAALGIVWLNRYRDDPFFRTEANVIAVQLCFGIVILGLVGVSFSLLYRDITTAILEGIQAGANADTPDMLANAVVGKIQQIRESNMLAISLAVILTTMLFGWIVARLTLAPTRNALATQKQFIGNVAHEIRTPLSVIKTNTEVTLLDRSLTAEVKQTLHSNVEELDRISEIINNLLSFSTLVRPDRVEFTTVDLSSVVGEVVEKFFAFAQKNEIEVTLRKSPEQMVWGSRTALQQIVGNLLKNALTYTPRGGRTSVTVEPTIEGIALMVEDSGIGIARKDLFRIFEPFYRSDRSRTRNTGGSGLGLAIVSELVKLHQGKIVIRSAVGRGTKVIVYFPAVKKHAAVGGQELREGHNEIAVDFSKQR